MWKKEPQYKHQMCFNTARSFSHKKEKSANNEIVAISISISIFHSLAIITSWVNHGSTWLSHWNELLCNMHLRHRNVVKTVLSKYAPRLKIFIAMMSQNSITKLHLGLHVTCLAVFRLYPEKSIVLHLPFTSCWGQGSAWQPFSTGTSTNMGVGQWLSCWLYACLHFSCQNSSVGCFQHPPLPANSHLSVFEWMKIIYNDTDYTLYKTIYYDVYIMLLNSQHWYHVMFSAGKEDVDTTVTII